MLEQQNTHSFKHRKGRATKPSQSLTIKYRLHRTKKKNESKLKGERDTNYTKLYRERIKRKKGNHLG